MSKSKANTITEAPLEEPAFTVAPAAALADLGRLVGPADDAQLAALLAGVTDAQLVEEGARIDTSRIVTDTVRIYGAAFEFWNIATPAQRRRLRGYSPALLTLGVHEALKLEQLREAHALKADADSSERATRDRSAATIFTTSIVLRDQAHSALRDAAGRDQTLRTAANESVGTAEDASALGRGLAALAALLR